LHLTPQSPILWAEGRDPWLLLRMTLTSKIAESGGDLKYRRSE
jgi:hypothetical protein